MRFGPNDKFWVVTDPTPESEIGDILFQASLHDLELQFKGGLTSAQHPTLYTERVEAESEAQARMVAARAARAIAAATPQKPLVAAARVAVLDANGKVLLELDLA